MSFETSIFKIILSRLILLATIFLLEAYSSEIYEDANFIRNIRIPTNCGADGTRSNTCPTNRGKCGINPRASDFTTTEAFCFCNNGYFGENCQYGPLCIDTVECNGNGNCIVEKVNNSFYQEKCICNQGFYGSLCLSRGYIVTERLTSTNRIRVWNLDGQTPLVKEVDNGNTTVLSMTTLPNGLLVTGGNTPQAQIRIWNLTEVAPTALPIDIGGTSISIVSLFVYSNEYLVSGANSGTERIRIWEINQSFSFYKAYNASGAIIALAKLSNGSLVSGSGPGGNQICLFDLNSDLPVRIVNTGFSIRALAGLANNFLASGSSVNGHSLRIWNFNLQEPTSVLIIQNNVVNSLIVLSNGLLASGVNSTTNQLMIWDVNNGNRLYRSFNTGGSFNTVSVNSLVQLENGLLVSASVSGTIGQLDVWDVNGPATPIQTVNLTETVRRIVFLTRI